MKTQDNWKILIVDDEEDVHSVTRLALKRLVYESRGMELLSAYSASKARELLCQHSDIAVLLLDVVMEDVNAGLDLVHYVRKEIKNKMIQIIIRTGYPGQAPEQNVTIEYEINDYRDKNELTSQKLKTAIITALRAYNALYANEEQRRGLKKVIETSTHIFRLQSQNSFMLGLLARFAAFSNLNSDAGYGDITGFVAERKNRKEFLIMTATGRYSQMQGKLLEKDIIPQLWQAVETVCQEDNCLFTQNHMIFRCISKLGPENIIVLEGFGDINEWEQDLLEMFRLNVSIAFDNNYLNQEIGAAQRELFFTLGEIAESRSHETGNHVKRVGEVARIIALKYGLSDEEAEQLKLAASMHDLGKLAIPDIILNKPGALTSEEFEVMKTHSQIGFEMLNSSGRMLLQEAAQIAYEHHENYDGTGYPCGLKGEEINIKSRIVAIADVFDAVGNKRIYKGPWPLDKILEYLKSQKGKKFDPQLTDLFFQNIDELLLVRELFPDE